MESMRAGAATASSVRGFMMIQARLWSAAEK